MDGLAPEPMQSWFAVKAAVALTPIITLGTADVIGWLLHRTLWRRTEVAPRSGSMNGLLFTKL
jgi:hypothetical protein